MMINHLTILFYRSSEERPRICTVSCNYEAQSLKECDITFAVGGTCNCDEAVGITCSKLLTLYFTL